MSFVALFITITVLLVLLCRYDVASSPSSLEKGRENVRISSAGRGFGENGVKKNGSRDRLSQSATETSFSFLHLTAQKKRKRKKKKK